MNTKTKMIPKDPLGVLSVLIIGRVSTPQQALSNIEASYSYARQALRGIHDGNVFVKALGEQGSGMRTDRATIVEAMAEIESGRWDVVLMEDVSRPYRNPRWIYAFIQDCVDQRVRVLAPGDNLDTWDDNWEVALGAAALRHGLHIPDTRRRVRRTATKSFHEGGMVLRNRASYRKLSKEEAASGQFGPPGLRIVKIPEWTAHLDHIREMLVVEKATLDDVLVWLKEKEIPPGPYVKSKTWNKKLLLDLLRDPILWGNRRFRQTIYEFVYSTGAHVREKNATPEVEVVPECAHMSKSQWDEMQLALNELGYGKPRVSGEKHPRFRKARKDSVIPLQFATCFACKDHLQTSGDGVVKCQHNCSGGDGSCWNHVESSCEAIREAVVDLLIARVDRTPGARQALVSEAWLEYNADHERTQALHRVDDQQIGELEAQGKKLTDAIKMGGKLELLVQELKTVEAKLKELRKQRVDRTSAAKVPPTAEMLDVDLRNNLLHLTRTSFKFAALVRRVFPLFEIQPVQALDSGLVRPRAKIIVDLRALVPGKADPEWPGPEEVPIDLFTPPLHIRQPPLASATWA